MADLGNYTRALLGQGLGMGWGDEAEAYARSLIGGSDYNKELAAINKDYGQFAQEHPITAPLTEFAGGMLPVAASYMLTGGSGGVGTPAAVATTGRQAGTLAKLAPYLAKVGKTLVGIAPKVAPEAVGVAKPVIQQMLSNVGRGALSGGLLGTVAGAGGAQPENRLGGAIGGGIGGTLLGGGIPLFTHGVGATIDWGLDRALPTATRIERAAADRINKALKSAQGGQGINPEESKLIFNRDFRRGLPSTYANVDPSLVSLAETVAQGTGRGTERVTQRIGSQAAGSRGRVYQRTKTALGGRDYFEDTKRVTTELRDKAKTLYDDAYSFGEVDDPIINKTLENKTFKKFYKKAREVAEDEATAAELRGENPEPYRLRDLYAVDAKGNLVQLKSKPDLRTLDYIKRGIDRVIEKGYKGKGMDTAGANALREIRKEYVAALDKATEVNGQSAYKNARRVYAGDMEVLDALRLGREEFKKLSHQEIGRLMSEMSVAEKEAFSTGALQHVYDLTMNSPQNINAASRLIGSPEMTEKLSALFDSPRKFALFQSALKRESQMVKEANKILAGAATKRRQVAGKEFEGGNQVGELVGDIISGGGWWKSLMGLAGKAAKSMNMTDDMADKVSIMLMSDKPDDVAAAVKILEKYGTKEQVKEGTMGAINAATIRGGTAMAPVSPYVESEKTDWRTASKKAKGTEQTDSTAVSATGTKNLPGTAIRKTVEPAATDWRAALKKLREKEAAANETK